MIRVARSWPWMVKMSLTARTRHPTVSRSARELQPSKHCPRPSQLSNFLIQLPTEFARFVLAVYRSASSSDSSSQHYFVFSSREERDRFSFLWSSFTFRWTYHACLGQGGLPHGLGTVIERLIANAGEDVAVLLRSTVMCT